MSRFPKIATSRPLASLLTASAIAAVMVLSTMGSAWAADTSAAATPAATTPASSDREAPTGSHIVSKPTDLGKIVVFGGAVHASGDTQWTDDDTSVAELPMAREQDSSKP